MKVKTADCRHGKFTFFDDDTYVGRSLDLYGEFSESEVLAYQTCVKAGDTCIVVGANIGALVVPLARLVGPTGRVIAFEPQPSNAMLLRENLTINGLDNVTVKQCAVGAYRGTTKIPHLDEVVNHNYGGIEIGQGSVEVKLETLDDCDVGRVNFIHIDAEGSEMNVLRGAEKLIKDYRPIIYCENDREHKALDLIGWLVDHDYRCWWHRPFLYNSENFNKQSRNVFGEIVSINMFCCPSEKKIEVRGLEEVGDLRITSDMYEREYKRFKRETERQPDDPTARTLTAHYASMLGRHDEARKELATLLQLLPDNAPALMIRGLLDLQQGKYDTGWDGYEYRHAISNKKHFGGDRQFTVPKWDGRSTDEPVLIWAEQGFGDQIMFARFMQDVLRLAPNAILEVQPQLFELFELSYISPNGLYRRLRRLPSYSYHCSLPSLPSVLKLHTEDQLRSSAYLCADPAMVEVWDKRLGNELRVGICWKGSPKSERPYSRDIAPELLEPLVAGFSVVDLTQQGQFESFADTAACISALDLVISVDTSVAHLAGALGKETWLLLSTDPDFRWGLGSDKCVWYDSMRIFRQKYFMEWSGVMCDVEAALALKLEQRGVSNG